MAAIHKRALPTVFAQNQVTSARDFSGEELRELRHDAFAIIQLTRYLADAVQFGAVKDLDTLARRRNRTSPMTWDRRGPSGGSRRTYSHDPNTEHSSAQTILTQLMRTMAHITCSAQRESRTKAHPSLHPSLQNQSLAEVPFLDQRAPRPPPWG